MFDGTDVALCHLSFFLNIIACEVPGISLFIIKPIFFKQRFKLLKDAAILIIVEHMIYRALESHTEDMFWVHILEIIPRISVLVDICRSVIMIIPCIIPVRKAFPVEINLAVTSHVIFPKELVDLVRKLLDLFRCQHIISLSLQEQNSFHKIHIPVPALRNQTQNNHKMYDGVSGHPGAAGRGG